MATNSQIAIYENSVLKFVSCHYDGYLLGVGLTLHKHYQDIERVRDLVNLGNLSVLGSSTECPENHSFENPIKGYTVAYHRDRQEDYRINIVTDIKKEQIHLMMSTSYNYVYMVDECKWYILRNKNFYPLDAVLKDKESSLIEIIHGTIKNLVNAMRATAGGVELNKYRKDSILELQQKLKYHTHDLNLLKSL